MSPHFCAVEPMQCIYEERAVHTFHKRAPPSDGTTGANPPVSKAVVVACAVAGSLVLILAMSLVYCCIRKRRASRRIGQLQRFLPTFMDQEKTEKYFQKQGSTTTLVGTAAASSLKDKEKELATPSNVHPRSRSASIAFTKGITDHKSRQLERDGSLGQFQQISLISEETVLEKEESEPKRSMSGKSRTTTVASPAVVKSSLHRSVSLNKHSSQGITNSRSGPIEDDTDHLDQPDRFAEGESLVAPNRFSTLLDFSNENLNRFSAQSIIDIDPNFDPTRFSTASVMFDAKRLSNVSVSSEDSVSTSSSDEFRKNLPPHQQQPSFHSHVNSPIDVGHEMSAGAPPSVAPNHPSYMGDKQELEEDQEYIPQPPTNYAPQVQDHQRQYYPPMQQYQNNPVHMQHYQNNPGYIQYQNNPSHTQPYQNNSGHMPMPMPMAMPVPSPTLTHSDSQRSTGSPLPPIPPRIMLSRPQSRQDMQVEDVYHH